MDILSLTSKALNSTHPTQLTRLHLKGAGFSGDCQKLGQTHRVTQFEALPSITFEQVKFFN